MSDALFKKIEKVIKSAKSIIVAAHQDPDGDAIGSLLALGLYLKKISKNPYIFSVSGVPEMFQFLPNSGLVKDRLPKRRFDLVLGLDYGARDRLGLGKYFQKYQPKLLAFDHHPRSRQGENFGIIDTNYPSTCEIIFDYFKAVRFSMDENIAKALMMGILTDTGFFKYTSKPESLERISELMRRFGLKIADMEHALYGHQKIEAVKLSGKILERTIYHKTGNFNYSYVFMKDLKNVNIEEVSGVIDRIRNIGKGKFALVLIEEPEGVWRGRLRSGADKSFDLNILAKKLGGGGHAQASGFRAKGQIDDIIKLVAKLSRDLK